MGEDQMFDEVVELERERDDLAAKNAAGSLQVAEMRKFIKELEKKLAALALERDEWQEKAWDLPMAAKKSGYEDGKMEMQKRVEDTELARDQLEALLHEVELTVFSINGEVDEDTWRRNYPAVKALGDALREE